MNYSFFFRIRVINQLKPNKLKQLNKDKLKKKTPGMNELDTRALICPITKTLITKKLQIFYF